MLIFVAMETMMFAGMISAFTIIKSSSLVWPPPDQPRLPVGQTAINTVALLLSGVALFFAQRGFARIALQGAYYCLVDWKGMLINRSSVEQRFGGQQATLS